MKRTKHAMTCLMGVVLMTIVAATTARAATPTLQGRLILRPLTPADKTLYGLPPTTEVSGGLTTVGVGTPVYLEAEVSSSIPAANIVSVTWVLTNRPVLSSAVLTSSPLGANVPIYDPSDRTRFQVAPVNGRMLLRPDAVGQYTVVATIVSSSYGTTNVTQTITAGTYVGLNTCSLCHSGSQIVTNEVEFWQTTKHSMIFSNGINGYLSSHYNVSCLACHTVGYDTTATATNGGFDDVAKQLNWTFPSVLSPTNWAALPDALKNLGNIQCENCHGPGSQHAYALGDTNLITRTVYSGDCNQCHDSPPNESQGAQWYVSRHAMTTGPSSVNCLPCHSGDGFIERRSASNTNYAVVATSNATFAPISCQACHEPHGDTVPTNNPHLIRLMGAVTMPDGTVVTNAGEGAVCLSCHQNRNGSATNQLVNYPAGKPTWFGGSSFGAHDNPQGDMIEGINANTYGQAIPSSAHRHAVANLCVGCHMQTVASSDPAFLLAGGHTFNMSYSLVTTNGTMLVTNSYDKVDVCVQCHGQIASFNIPRGDLNGDGVIEGVQTEVQHMLDTLSTLLPNSSGVVDGLVKTRISVTTNWSQQFLKAAYNWQFVSNDGSLGVHNAPFAAGILKASIADLTGNATAGGSLSQADAQFYVWQCQYFGSATNPNAAPNATPANDGIPNWVKYSLGLNPLIPGAQVPGGVVWANGKSLGGSAPTNAVQIYTAAEVTFNTTVHIAGEWLAERRGAHRRDGLRGQLRDSDPAERAAVLPRGSHAVGRNKSNCIRPLRTRAEGFLFTPSVCCDAAIRL
jgi:hypothetical protein